MFKNYLLSAFRNVFKNRKYLLINILGLAIGLSASIYIILFVQFELSFDKFHSQADQIYRIGVRGMMMNNEINQAITAAPMAEALRNEFPEVVTACRIQDAGDWLIKYEEKKINEQNMLFADSTFFQVFSFRLLKGDPNKVLQEPKSIVITETAAKKYFGNDDPIGKLVKVETDTTLYKVTGLMEDVPENSHFKFELLGSLVTLRGSRNTFWISHNFYTYVVLKNGTDPIEFENKIQSMVTKYVGPQIEQYLGVNLEQFSSSGNYFGYFIQPITDIHLKSDLQYEIEANGNIVYVYIFISIALFILIIACINFTNIATARSSTRSKEIGIRKVVGAMKKHLVLQFLLEAFIICSLSLGLALFILEFFMPGLNNLVQLPLDLEYFGNLYTIPFLLGLVIIVSFLAGGYPAFFLSSFKPISVLKGKLKLGAKGGFLRAILVISQFIVSVFILLSTFTVYDQLNYILNKDLGFDKENILMIRRSDALKTQMEAFKDKIKEIPAVISVTNSNTYPGKNFSNNAFFLEGEPTSNTYLLNQAWVSYDFEKTFGFKMKEGRFFSRDFPTDSQAIVINEAAVKSLGFDNPIGKRILHPQSETELEPYTVIGVVKNFHFKSLHTTIEPAAFTIMPGNWEGVVCVKINPENTQATINSIQKIWEEFTSDFPFEYFFFDDYIRSLYKSEQRTSRVFVLFSILSIIISFLGLLGLISFMTEQRKKEVGIRKTFGSTSLNIIIIYCKEILKLIVIASLIAWPIAYFVMNRWLQDFSYRVNINLFMFIVITLITIILSLITVVYQAYIAAKQNPSETLRYE
ncbi:MAG: ABC transporter permease [Bacteroidales bacterium]|jgi:putative ABC transport system permease protein|nr:ABC transporter permease [Bacteroidales bacterium]